MDLKPLNIIRSTAVEDIVLFNFSLGHKAYKNILLKMEVKAKFVINLHIRGVMVEYDKKVLKK